MGLDMYLYKFTKPETSAQELSKMTYEELQQNDYHVFSKYGELPDNFQAIMPFTIETDVEAEYVDFDAVKKHYHIPDDARCVGESYSSQEIGYTFCISEKEHKHIDIPMKEFKSKFLVTRRTPIYCIQSEQVGYWRKNYELQDSLTEACNIPIDNCGYYPLNTDMWKVLEKMDPKTYEKIKDYRHDPDCIIAYLEWY